MVRLKRHIITGSIRMNKKDFHRTDRIIYNTLKYDIEHNVELIEPRLSLYLKLKERFGK